MDQAPHLLTRHFGCFVEETGVYFSLYAPKARRVFIAGCFSDKKLEMKREGKGVYSLFIPLAKDGDIYRYHIEDKDGNVHDKIDLFAQAFQMRPEKWSVVCKWDYVWRDASWMESRRVDGARNILEVHLGSFMRKENGDFYTYLELAEKLTLHCKKFHFTHVELLPITEHPLDASWGYQVTGFFAPTSRFGMPEEFARFVDILHQNQVGVILDFVPAHFPKDSHGLKDYDGSSLFSHDNPKRKEQPEWTTELFDFSKNETQNFLISSALHFAERFHIDGFRVDAVSAIIFHDYNKHEWIPNEDGGPENYDGIAFCQRLNSVMHNAFHGIEMIAEESTIYKGVTSTLGFDRKWNIGWMHDTLQFFTSPLDRREDAWGLLVHTLSYVGDEAHVLSLSHDEVKPPFGAFLSKMSGENEEQVLQAKLLREYQFCFPGKKLLFMGTEFGTKETWDFDNALNFSDKIDKIEEMNIELGKLYKEEDSLWGDHLDLISKTYPLLIYKRGELVCAHNFGKEDLSFEMSGELIYGTEKDMIPGYSTHIYREKSREKTIR